MPGNSFGTCFKITTWGESHGKAVGVVIDGCPAGIELSEGDIQGELDRRRPGVSKVTSPREESDRAEILSGVFEGRTTGTPLSILVKNSDALSQHYEEIKELYRPGHADYTYDAKYGFRDYRGGGRSSGRETIGRVASGAVAKKILAGKGITVTGYTVKIGDIAAEHFDRGEIENNDVRCPDPEAAGKMVEFIQQVRSEGDSVGGVVEIVVDGVPPGLGEPVFDKLDSDIARGLMSIGSVKGVEIGDGFECAGRRGSQNNDGIYSRDGKISFGTNHAGGILGGISNGDRIVARIAVKPTPSISIPQKTVDREGCGHDIIIEGRHDPCICPRIVPVAEAMVSLVVTDHLLRARTARIDRL